MTGYPYPMATGLTTDAGEPLGGQNPAVHGACKGLPARV